MQQFRSDVDFLTFRNHAWTSRARDQHCRRQLVRSQLFLLQSHVLCARPFFITRRSRTGVTMILSTQLHWNACLPQGQSCTFSQALTDLASTVSSRWLQLETAVTLTGVILKTTTFDVALFRQTAMRPAKTSNATITDLTLGWD